MSSTLITGDPSLLNIMSTKAVCRDRYCDYAITSRLFAIPTNEYTHKHTHVYSSLYLCIYLSIHLSISIYIHMYIHQFVYTHTHNICIFRMIYLFMHSVFIHTYI